MFDAVLNMPKFTALAEGGTCYCRHFHLSPGGAGNVAVALSKLGEKVIFAAKVGNDYLGKLYLENLNNNGVTPEVFVNEGVSTGFAAVLSSAKERSFIVHRGANDTLTVEEVYTLQPWIEKSKFFYFSGYSLVNNPQRTAVIKAAEIAKDAKATIVFDPGAYNLIESNTQLFMKLLHKIDVLSTNLKEARILTATDTTDKMVERLRNKVKMAAIKCGTDGSIIVQKQKTVKTPAFHVKAKDTTGAGDAFTAALIHGLSQNLGIQNLGRFTNWFAAQTTTGYGARNFPTQKAATNFLKSIPA